MNRLTNREKEISLPNSKDALFWARVHEKLVAYEDAEAEGRLIVLPCKVGRTVYSITACSCADIDGGCSVCQFYRGGMLRNFCALPKDLKCPYAHRIDKLKVTDVNALMVAKRWGKTVFLTSEEAEAAMKG